MVKVAYLPDADGAKQGVDDFFAAGGTVAELKALSTRFDPRVLPRLRLSKDAKLAAAVADLRRKLEARPQVTRGDHTRRSVMRYLTAEAEKDGKVTKEGIEVQRSVRQIAVGAAVSHQTAYKATLQLEEAEDIQRDNTKRKKESAGIIVLLCTTRAQKVDTMEGEAHRKGEERSQKEDNHTVTLARAPSNPGTYAADDRGVNLLRASPEVPELRWGYVEKQRASMKVGIEGKAVHTVEYQYRERLGKKRGGIVEAVVKAGRRASVSELMEDFAGARTRRRDFVRRNITPLVEAGIMHLVEDTVTLTDNWREALENARTLGGEQEQTQLQEERYRRQSKAYRDRHKVKPEPVPDPPQVDNMSKLWPHHPEHCSCKECESRFGKVIGEHAESCYCGECKARRNGKTPEPRWRHLYVVPEPTPMAEPEDWRTHSLDCECSVCLYPEPSYARVRGAM